VTAPLPRNKLGFGGGRGFARFVGGWVTSSNPATGGTSAGGAGRCCPGTPVGDNCGPPVVRQLAEGPESAIPAGRPRTNVGGLPHGFLTSGGPTQGSGGRPSKMAGDWPDGAEVTLWCPSKHTTVPFPSRRTKAGIVAIPNRVINN
jgi:hypothetical protein